MSHQTVRSIGQHLKMAVQIISEKTELISVFLLVVMIVLNVYLEYVYVHNDLSVLVDYYITPEEFRYYTITIICATLGLINIYNCTREYMILTRAVLDRSRLMDERSFFLVFSLCFSKYIFQIIRTTSFALVVPTILYLFLFEDGNYVKDRYVLYTGVFFAIVSGIVLIIDYLRQVIGCFKMIKIIMSKHGAVTIQSSYHRKLKEKTDYEEESDTSNADFVDQHVVFTLCDVDRSINHESMVRGKKDYENQNFRNYARYTYTSSVYNACGLFVGVTMMTESIYLLLDVYDLYDTSYVTLYQLISTLCTVGVVSYFAHLVFDAITVFYRWFRYRTADTFDVDLLVFTNVFWRDIQYGALFMLVRSMSRENCYFEESDYLACVEYTLCLGICVLRILFK